MNILEAIILGILQGATEFLPISSSGHLVLVPAILGLNQPSLEIIAMAHGGTLLAVLIYFRQDIGDISGAIFEGLRAKEPMGTPKARLGWYILAGSIPVVALGVLSRGFFENVFSTPRNAAVGLLLTAGVLLWGERMLSGTKGISRMGWPDAIVIGLFQALALFPGISRSGSTISAGLWRGLNRETAARFSFLLGIPAILGAGILATLNALNGGNMAEMWPLFLAAFLSAFITGYLCIYFLLAWLRKHSLTIFAIYCALLGGGYLLFTWLG